MQLIVSARKISLSSDFREYIERQMHFALGRFATIAGRVQVSLSDENGPRGGVDKLCRVVVRTRHHGEIVSEGRATSSEAAVDAAADRASRAVARAIRRSHWHKRNRTRRMSAAGEQD